MGMKIKLYAPLVIHSDHDVVLPASDQPLAGDHAILIACDDERVASELYSHISSNCDLAKAFAHEEFKAALNHALNCPDHRVRSCNLAMAVVSRAGCLVAQMGKSRVLQVRPSTQEIEYDSRAQVLDIYSSKAKVELIKDLRAGDYIVLCTAENIEVKAVRKTMCDAGKDDHAKLADIAQILKPSKTDGGHTPALAFARVEEAQGGGASMPSFAFIKPKRMLYALLAAAVVGAATWVLTANPFSDTGHHATVDPDSLVTDKAPDHAKISFAVDSAALKAKRDSLAGVQLKKDSLRRAQRLRRDSTRKIELEKKKALEAAKESATMQQDVSKEKPAEPKVRDLKPITPPPAGTPAVQAPKAP